MARMLHMAKRADTKNLQFRMRTPTAALPIVRGRQVMLRLDDKAVVETTIGNVISFSLRTGDPWLAEQRELAARSQLRKFFVTAEAGPKKISFQQLTALSKTAYAALKDLEANPGKPFQVAASKALDRAAYEGRVIHNLPTILPGKLDADETELAQSEFGSDLTSGINSLPISDEPVKVLEQRFGSLANWVLMEFSVELDREDRERFLSLIASATIDGRWRLKRASMGDYSPDPKEERFPKLELQRDRVTLTGLLDAWWIEAKKAGRSPQTKRLYGIALGHLRTFLKHDDASRITTDDILRFKDHRLKTVSIGTFRTGDLNGLRTIFNWAVQNKKLASNPVTGVRVMQEKKQRTRSPGFTDEEAIKILQHAAAYVRAPLELEKTALAKKWISWICAYSGARVGEIVQLRKQDVLQEGEVWCMRITPEAGSVKAGDFRLVPLHQHLIDQGFVSVVQAREDGPLFLTSDGAYSKPGMMQRLRETIRDIVPDERIAPFHAWRHRVQTLFLDAGVNQRTINAVQGWTPGKGSGGSAAASYGEVSLQAKVAAIGTLPRYNVP